MSHFRDIEWTPEEKERRRKEIEEINARMEAGCSIPWRKPSEERPNYDNIWVIDGHWKESVPLSYRIVACRRLYAGPENEEQKIQLTTDDEHGEGSWGPDWDDVVAWCYVHEVELLPSWVQK